MNECKRGCCWTPFVCRKSLKCACHWEANRREAEREQAEEAHRAARRARILEERRADEARAIRTAHIEGTGVSE